MGYEHPPTVNFAIVLGLGEIGKPIYGRIKELNPGRKVTGYDPRFNDALPPEEPYMGMHICFPETFGFVDIIQEYVERYTPDCVIIHSTVSPGMTQRLNDTLDVRGGVYYSPVRGNVKDGMGWSLVVYTKYVAGYASKHNQDTVVLYLSRCGFRPKWTGDPESLEWAKLLDLAWYATNIAFFQEAERILEDRDLSWEVLEEFMKSTQVESEGKVQRSVFYGGHIGGHCVIPAIEKILPHVSVPLFWEVLKSNIHRKYELVQGKPSHHPE